jgi:hypothetical protein
MHTKSNSRDRRLISSQPHELKYAGGKLGAGGKEAIVSAKKTLGRQTSRTKVMAEAQKIMDR